MTALDGARPRAIASATRLFVGLLVLNAIVAIVAIVGASGDTAWRIVGTTMAATGGCLLVAADLSAIGRGRLRRLATVSAVSGGLAVGGLIVAIWAEDVTDSEWFWKPVLVLLVLGLAGTYAAVLATARLLPAWEVARWCGWAAAAGLAGITVVAILWESQPPAELYAVLWVVLATSTVVALIGAITQRREHDRAGQLTQRPGPRGTLVCPVCRSAVGDDGVAGAHTCPSCGLTFTIHESTGRPARPTSVGA